MPLHLDRHTQVESPYSKAQRQCRGASYKALEVAVDISTSFWYVVYLKNCMLHYVTSWNTGISTKTNIVVETRNIIDMCIYIYIYTILYVHIYTILQLGKKIADCSHQNSACQCSNALSPSAHWFLKLSGGHGWHVATWWINNGQLNTSKGL